MSAQKRVLLLGGTGHYGRWIARSLVQGGASVRVLSRDGDSARRILGSGPEVIVGDVTSRLSVMQALEGAESVVIAVSASSSPKAIRKREIVERDAVIEVLKQSEQQGILRVVYLCGYDVQEELARRLGVLAFARPMLDVQAHLAQSKLNWTVLGCAPSKELFFAMIRGSRMNVPGGGPEALPTISPLDVGAIAAQAALREDLGGRRIRMPGPEALSFAEAARRISEVWRRPIRVRRIPLLPIRIAGAISWPFYPFLRFMWFAIKLMNNFPQELVAQVPADHQELLRTFSFTPTTLEQEAHRRLIDAEP